MNKDPTKGSTANKLTDHSLPAENGRRRTPERLQTRK